MPYACESKEKEKARHVVMVNVNEAPLCFS